MTTVLTIIHIIVCLFLIAVVLLQSGKGAEMGAAFGGSSQTLFGSRGAASFLSKMTSVAAVVFMLTSLSLAIVASRGGSSVLQQTPASRQQSSPPVSGPLQAPQQQVPETQPQAPPQAPLQNPSNSR